MLERNSLDILNKTYIHVGAPLTKNHAGGARIVNDPNLVVNHTIGFPLPRLPPLLQPRYGHKNMRIRTKPLRSLQRGAEHKNKRVLDNRLFACHTIVFPS